MGFFSSIGNALKSFAPKLLRGMRNVLPKITKGIKSGVGKLVKGVKRLFGKGQKEATGRIGREVIKQGKRGRNIVRKVKKSGIFPPKMVY